MFSALIINQYKHRFFNVMLLDNNNYRLTLHIYMYHSQLIKDILNIYFIINLDQAMKIHISEITWNHISDHPYRVEERGSIPIKVPSPLISAI